MRINRAGLIVALIGLLAGTVRAAEPVPPLANHVPGDAIMYVGWAGSDALGPKYIGSHLKNILDASDMPALFDEFVPQMIKRVARDDKDAAEVIRQVVEIGAPLWKHPTAIYFGGVDLNAPQPVIHLAVLCSAGTDAPALAERIGKLLDQAPKDNGPVPIVRTYGTMVVLAFGTPASVDADFAKPPVASLAAAPKFIAALKQVQPDPAYIEYIDAEAGVKLIDDAMAKQNQPQMTEKWNHARDALGLSGLHQLIVTAGFEGHGWGDAAFISCAEGRKGILAFLNATPLSTDLLKVVPLTADEMIVGKFDLDALVGNVRSIIAEVDAGTAEQMDEGLAKFNEVAGLDLRKDVLANLGDEWVLYSDRSVGGPGFMGSVIVNKLKDADAFDKSMEQLAERANAIIANQMHDPSVKIEFHESTVGGVKLHYLAVPFVTPCWGVKDGYLFVGLYPQVVTAAIDQVDKKMPSIQQRPEFVTLQKQLGDHAACGMSFSNLPSTAREGYTGVLALSRLYLGFGDIYGLHVPPMVIPPLGKITPELAPAGSISWTDAAGFHMKSSSPFPGAEMFAGSSMGSSVVLGEGSLMVSILLPSLNKARETANRAKCASNEHQMGLGIILYANENNQKMPDDLGTLLKDEGLTMSVFICPSSGTQLPANAATMTVDEKAAWVNEHSDYVYLGKGLKQNQVDATRVVVYEKDGAHEGDGMNLLYGDGHAEWQHTAAAMAQIKAQQGK